MKKIIFVLVVFISNISVGQKAANDMEKVFRVNAISPGLEFELPVSAKSTMAANAGIGIQGTYLNLDDTNSGVTYYIAPFLDLSYKYLYNRDKRIAKGKSIEFNSGNYWGLRLLTNFKEIESHNVSRRDDINFAFGPTWGIQRAYGKMHLLFDLGPVYYFDTKGNNGFFPVMLQLNIGYNLKKW
ncbi:hypothetical protein MASR2M47_44790 [Draconibacterium sp.]|jgi:hypothetical protein